jgi:hypothetical protein
VRAAEFLIEAAKSASFIVLNIERLPVVGADATVQKSIDVLIEAVTSAKSVAPAAKFGYYSLIPNRDFFRAIQGKNSAKYHAWQAENDRLKAVATVVDFTCPSLYTFYDDVPSWKTFAIEQIDEARRLAPGKPVFPFVWPRFHESNKKLANAYIPAGFWTAQLALVKAKADGLVLWGGYQENWNEGAAWWSATKNFINEVDR